MKTTIYKGHYGWTAESHSETNANGKLWQITTIREHNGVISCTAIEGEDKGNGLISYDMFGAKRLQLASRTGKATEKAIAEVHAEGLEAFKAQQAEEAQTKPGLYVIEVGQVIFTDANFEEKRRRAVYEVVRPGTYKTVALDGSQIFTDDHVEPYSNKFGIGSYYNEGDKIGILEVQELVKQAKENIRLRDEAEAKERAEKQAERDRKLIEGAKIIDQIPAGAKTVICAEFRVDDSDGQSDYFSSHTEDIVFLAWSRHDKNLFPELRKAAGKFEGTKQYETDNSDNEHRENYSGGSGYYLGESKYHGWIVRKRDLQTDPKGYGISLETLQIAAAEGKFLCGQFDEAQTDFEPVDVKAGTVQIIDYSERAIAVVGDTKPIKDKLKALGGKFNFRLSCGAGWIFPKTKLETVQKALNVAGTSNDASLVQAQEDAVFDNFCHANNI